MLKYFSSEYLSRYLSLGILLLICWIPALLLKEQISFSEEPLYQLYLWITSSHFYLQMGIGFTLSLFIALMTNNILKTFGLSGKVTTLGMLVSMLLMSAIWSQIGMNPLLWVNFLFVFLFWYMYTLASTSNPIPISFNAGLLIGSASLLYTPLVLLMPTLWFALLTHRTASPRSITVSVAGALTPIFFALSWFYWESSLDQNYQLWILRMTLDMGFVLERHITEKISLIALGVLIGLAAWSTFVHLSEKNINLRRNLSISLFALLNLLAISFLFKHNQQNLGIIVIPSALLVTQYLLGQKKQRWFNLILTLLTLLIICNLYLHFLYA